MEPINLSPYSIALVRSMVWSEAGSRISAAGFDAVATTLLFSILVLSRYTAGTKKLGRDRMRKLDVIGAVVVVAAVAAMAVRGYREMTTLGPAHWFDGSIEEPPVEKAGRIILAGVNVEVAEESGNAPDEYVDLSSIGLDIGAGIGPRGGAVAGKRGYLLKRTIWKSVETTLSRTLQVLGMENSAGLDSLRNIMTAEGPVPDATDTFLTADCIAAVARKIGLTPRLMPMTRHLQTPYIVPLAESGLLLVIRHHEHMIRGFDPAYGDVVIDEQLVSRLRKPGPVIAFGRDSDRGR